VIPYRLTVREIPKLRKSAQHAPNCFSCGATNRGGNLCLAHSNELRLGRGASFKSPDYYGAILCPACHDIVDGRAPSDLTKEGKREMHRLAHEKTLAWWFEAGILE